MINLSLTKEQFKILLLNYELGKLIKGDVVEDKADSISENLKLNHLLYKSGVDKSKITIQKENLFRLAEEFEDEIDSIYEKFIDFVLSGEYEKEMEKFRNEIEEMNNDKEE